MNCHFLLICHYLMHYVTKFIGAAIGKLLEERVNFRPGDKIIITLELSAKLLNRIICGCKSRDWCKNISI